MTLMSMDLSTRRLRLMSKRQRTLEDLSSSDAGFANAENLSMAQGPSVSQVQAPADVDDGVDTSGIPFIVGIAVAGVAVVAVFGLFLYSRRRRRKTFSGTTDS